MNQNMHRNDELVEVYHPSGTTTPTLHSGAMTPIHPAHVADCSKTTFARHSQLPISPDLLKTALAPVANTSGRCPSVEELGSHSTGPKHEKLSFRLAAGAFAYFCCGWGDGLTATLLPFFMREFSISFSTSCLLYAASTIGFLSGSFLLERILQELGSTTAAPGSAYSWFPYLTMLTPKHKRAPHARYSFLQGRHLALAFFSGIWSLYFILMGSKSGFPALFVAYSIAACSRAVMSGTLNPYFASIGTMYIGYSQAMWSLGNVVAPLICQTIVAKGVPWPYFYYGSLLLAAINFTMLSGAFLPTTAELATERRRDSADTVVASPCATPTLEKTEKIAFHSISEKLKPKTKPTNMLALTISHPFMWVASLWSGLYYGTETTSQTFIVSYLVERRSGDPKTVGYIPACFFAGIMTGRILWGVISQKLGLKQRNRIIAFGLTVAVAMQLVIWFVDSVPGNAVAIVVIGLVYGPAFPACMNMSNDILPAEQQLIGMALLNSGTSLGCAILPFLSGVLLNATSLEVLPYWNVAFSAAVLGVWLCLPSQVPVLGASRWLSKKQS